MPKTPLICGSYAFDSIMVFNDHFKNHILPDQVHMLNIAFLVPTLRKEFGGCAGNIAYNLQLLGGNPLPMATVGEDFEPYLERIKKQGINTKYIKTIAGTHTGQAFITTDLGDNQITAFHPGAMDKSHHNQISEAVQANEIAIGIISPDGREGMIAHAAQFVQAKIEFIFDPGQGLPMFDGAQLRTFIEQASYLTLNDYEAQMLQDKTGLSLRDISRQVKALIVTKGAHGCDIYTRDTTLRIKAARAEATKDPTGCGDAYRAGLLFGLMHGLDWQTIGQLSSVLGAINIAHLGTQNHTFDLALVKQMYLQNYGEMLELDTH